MCGGEASVAARGGGGDVRVDVREHPHKAVVEYGENPETSMPYRKVLAFDSGLMRPCDISIKEHETELQPEPEPESQDVELEQYKSRETYSCFL